jgi:hypothetical protein
MITITILVLVPIGIITVASTGQVLVLVPTAISITVVGLYLGIRKQEDQVILQQDNLATYTTTSYV